MSYLAQISQALESCIESNHALAIAVEEAFNDEDKLTNNDWLINFENAASAAKADAKLLAEAGPVPDNLTNLHDLAVAASENYCLSVDCKLEWARTGDISNLEISALYMKQATEILKLMMSQTFKL